VFKIDLGTNALTFQSTELGIDKFSESAGLHRSHGVGVYAWADSHANGTGTVYVLTAK
jgi:hypothetical protein